MAKVWVGTTLSEKLELTLGMLKPVETGERVVAMRERLMWWVSERMLRASRGPKTSMAWKAGKRTTPKRVGTVGVGGGLVGSSLWWVVHMG